MLYGNKVSLKNIITKVYRDLQLKEEDVFLDMIEWGAEALEQIGAFNQLDHIVNEELCINMYKAPLPLGLVALTGLLYHDRPLVPNTNIYGPAKEGVPIPGISPPYSINEAKIENTIFVNTTLRNQLENDGYQIQHGYIKTPFKEGKLYISYDKMPIDCEGYPEVPDEVSFREAVYRYIVYKWMYPKVITGEINDRLLQDAEQKWHWYCNQAGAKAMSPDLNQLEAIKRNFIAQKPNLNMFDNFFKDLNKLKDYSSY